MAGRNCWPRNAVLTRIDKGPSRSSPGHTKTIKRVIIEPGREWPAARGARSNLKLEEPRGQCNFRQSGLGSRNGRNATLSGRWAANFALLGSSNPSRR